ncbi:MAG TPA: tetratricopeptide repeat protein [Burkholderiales bacterium]|nr:tetratricopeptide repeat protein [Burkholderiales bacterium]
MKPGRNDPCPCGSGRKYKHCCGGATPAATGESTLLRAVQLHQQGHLDLAQSMYAMLLQEQPGNAHALHYLGIIAYQRGKDADAADLFRRAIAADGGVAEFHLNLGNTLNRMGQPEEAAEAFRRAVVLRPDSAPALYAMGLMEVSAGRKVEALECFRRALAVRPDFPEAHFQAGRLLGAMGLAAEAAPHLEEFLSARPDDPDAWSELGALQLQAGMPADAARSYRRAMSVKGESAELLNNLGTALLELGELTEGETCFRRAIAQKPEFAVARGNLANALKDQARAEEAAQEYRATLELSPDYADACSNMLMAMNYSRGISREALYRQARGFNDLVARRAAPPVDAPARDREPGRRLRLAYLSPDLCRHAVGSFIEPILGAHDRRRFEVTCYNDAPVDDDWSERLRGLSDHWVKVRGMDHESLARRIVADGIDVLVELAGHTRDNRLLCLARRPAPVQVSYLGYPDTTGLDAIGFRVTDWHADPAGTEAWSSERLLRLPHSYFCFRAPRGAPEVAPPPALRNGCVTFGSFNNYAKVSPAALELWAAALRAVPGSRLYLKARALADTPARERLLAALAALGVDPERVRLQHWTPRGEDHLAAYGQVDLALDTTPYNGATTTCEALWMGVPVLSLAGATHAGRMGLSILSAAGLAEFAPASPEAFVALCRRLAGDMAQLGDLRAGMRERLRASPLMDEAGFARGLEAAYRDAWVRWCRA